MDQLDGMRLFVRVAEQGSFSTVAQQRGVARSVVTRRISALEGRLGVKLLARSTRRLSLTSAGSRYLEQCREILKLVEAAETGLDAERQRPRGLIRVSLPVSFGQRYLAPLLLEFSKRYPEISLNMDFTDRRSRLIEEGVDLAIRITERLGEQEIARRLGSAQLVVVASPEYLRRRGEPRHPASLSEHECLAYTLASSASWSFLDNGEPLNVPVQGRIQANSGSVLLQAAVEGLGITCQPRFLAEEALASGALRVLLTDYTLPQIGIYAVLPGNRHIPFKVRTLIDYLGERLRGGMQPRHSD
jgi:DNA-binding transcriptional LysR family regulator